MKGKEGGCSRADMDILQVTNAPRLLDLFYLFGFFFGETDHRQHFKSTDHFNKLER